MRLGNKTPYQKKLDRQLFEAVGNGDRCLEHLAFPNLDTVKQLICNRATVDHFVCFSPPGDDGEIYSLAYKNAIDTAINNKTPGQVKNLGKYISECRNS